ncbi:hypothetical protein CFC21_001802 [Triticum aestivum]|uniref:Uncharacterized protein n=1 Tax=Triticum aestivum TaxID=4565 RepID=A0A3B5XYN7_WHEAT|nr:uncharacterized protein LOC119285880 [Triticum dicoccoides]XP_044397784.1 uncharacterized protein LOC123121768 [Triticum aestivum]KAF6983663.1 hypothetical protein CFC21_001802 [Triticum aestivum]
MADANRWRGAAHVVSQAFAQAVGVPEEVLRSINLAIAKLEARAGLLRAIRDGATLEEATAGYVEPGPDGVLPAALLEDARRGIKRRRSLHSLARGLPLCARALGRAPDAETIQRWEICNVAVLTYARRAQMGLRNAASFYMAAGDAIVLASVLPFGAPLRVAWMGAAERLTRLAAREATMARDNMFMMGLAVGQQAWLAMAMMGLAPGALGGGVNNQVHHQ